MKHITLAKIFNTKCHTKSDLRVKNRESSTTEAFHDMLDP
jgi:hypothetical protein